MKKINIIVFLITVLLSFSAQAEWKAAWFDVVGIGFSPKDREQHIQVNLTFGPNPPAGYSEGQKIETVVLKEGNLTDQTLNRIYSLLVAAMHAEQRCWAWIDDGQKVHRNRYELGDIFCEK